MATDQIRQMVNFILQEAHEKANEIRVKVRYAASGYTKDYKRATWWIGGREQGCVVVDGPKTCHGLHVDDATHAKNPQHPEPKPMVSFHLHVAKSIR